MLYIVIGLCVRQHTSNATTNIQNPLPRLQVQTIQQLCTFCCATRAYVTLPVHLLIQCNAAVAVLLAIQEMAVQWRPRYGGDHLQQYNAI